MTAVETTGTPPLDDGDAAVQSPTTGTPNGDGRDAEQGEPDYKAIHLANKGTIDALKAELEELRNQREEVPEDDESTNGGGEGELVLSREDIVRLESDAIRGDIAAKAALVAYRKQEQTGRNQAELARTVRDSFHLRDIEDKSERKEVLAHFAKNRNRLGDIQAAKAEVRERKLDSENAQLRKDLEAARKQPPTDVVRTHSREVPSSEAKARKMTISEFDREQAQLKAQGDYQGAMERQKQLMRGEIDIPD